MFKWKITLAREMSVVPSGDTASRPENPEVGQEYLDTDLGFTIWFDGTVWIDATGVDVDAP